jgi:hypothetical protein
MNLVVDYYVIGRIKSPGKEACSVKKEKALYNRGCKIHVPAKVS